MSRRIHRHPPQKRPRRTHMLTAKCNLIVLLINQPQPQPVPWHMAGSGLGWHRCQMKHRLFETPSTCPTSLSRCKSSRCQLRRHNGFPSKNVAARPAHRPRAGRNAGDAHDAGRRCPLAAGITKPSRSWRPIAPITITGFARVKIRLVQSEAVLPPRVH